MSTAFETGRRSCWTESAAHCSRKATRAISTAWWIGAPRARKARQAYSPRVTIGEDLLPDWDIRDVERTTIEHEADARAWLVANLGMRMPWYSAKRLRTIVDTCCALLDGIGDNLALVRFTVLEKLLGFVED